MSYTKYQIRDHNGLVFGRFSDIKDRDFALRKYVKEGFPTQEVSP